VECTVNRVRDRYFSQMERNGHDVRAGDLERFASLGIRAIRYPVLWERTAPDGVAHADWSWPDQRLARLRELDVTPIVGLVHHGSGPRHTNLLDPGFASGLAEFAGAVAERYPWVEYYTPVNEPLTTARFSGLYGVWYPHAADDRSFLLALLNQCRAVVLSMRAIRAVNPAAKLVQTDDLGKNYGTPEVAAAVDFYNQRRWLTWDLLCGRFGPEHPLWGYAIDQGIAPEALLWFRDNPCPPDVIGANYYVTSERWLDHRIDRYPPDYVGAFFGQALADVETPRVLAQPTKGIAGLLEETWERYHLPIAVTEAHIDANREDQLRWLLEIWEAAQAMRQRGADVRAVTVWALLGSFDWNCLVAECRGYYEPGPFDVRAAEPRPTAVAALMRELAAGRAPTHPILQLDGWWRAGSRFLCEPVPPPLEIVGDGRRRRATDSLFIQPVLITGAAGSLGRAFARICETRNIAHRIVSRQELDIADPEAVERMIQRLQPWAIVNARAHMRVDDAEGDPERCFRENTVGPSILAAACARHGLQLVTFSSDLVFDGLQQSPYVERDAVAPLNVYGRSKAEAERSVLDHDASALVIRTAALFGPWDETNFVTRALKALEAGNTFLAACDTTVSPTYLPDLVHASLDLLIDRERGIWHLSNADPISWAELALKASEAAGVDASRLDPRPQAHLGYIAPRPRYSALHSERASLLPNLDDALSRYLRLQRDAAEQDRAGMAAVS
jgi:dTDP-4-dehydrorhamnose reductase